MEVLQNGGWVLWVIIALSISSLAIVIQKLWFLKETRVSPLFLQTVKQQLNAAGKDHVIEHLQQNKNMESQLALLAVTQYKLSDDIIESNLKEVTQNELQLIKSKIGFISMVATIAPVLGLLGTVLGLMDVFAVLAVEGVGDAQLLSAGISKALITTVAGLSLAIPLIFVHQLLIQKVEKRLDQWDRIPTQLIALLRSSNG
ncbi:MAG: MotA/TolQ/ExbB proton channel family protein [Candidatus Margulisiibacteriota bacterium]|nr:MotA/TolQ/ExbB proton channel family protein [Candidatus Margulisiibacteriota bacterium]